MYEYKSLVLEPFITFLLCFFLNVLYTYVPVQEIIPGYIPVSCESLKQIEKKVQHGNLKFYGWLCHQDIVELTVGTRAETMKYLCDRKLIWRRLPKKMHNDNNARVPIVKGALITGVYCSGKQDSYTNII